MLGSLAMLTTWWCVTWVYSNKARLHYQIAKGKSMFIGVAPCKMTNTYVCYAKAIRNMIERYKEAVIVWCQAFVAWSTKGEDGGCNNRLLFLFRNVSRQPLQLWTTLHIQSWSRRRTRLFWYTTFSNTKPRLNRPRPSRIPVASFLRQPIQCQRSPFGMAPSPHPTLNAHFHSHSCCRIVSLRWYHDNRWRYLSTDRSSELYEHIYSFIVVTDHGRIGWRALILCNRSLHCHWTCSSCFMQYHYEIGALGMVIFSERHKMVYDLLNH